MVKVSLLGTTALRSAAVAGLIAFAVPAAAQDTPAAASEDTPAVAQDVSATSEDTQTSETSDNNAIVVTGSRIRRPNLDSAIPVTSVQGQEFFETGKTSIGDTLNELPALRSTFSQSNSTRFLGTTGLNLLDLRGLGTERTLVLVNGRRHVGGDVLSSGVAVNIESISADLIERVDVVTGGSSAVYGSDALAGVVNFVLKDNFDGLQLRAQGGASTYGDNGSYFASALIGKNFADGRGNVAISLEYARANEFFSSDREYARRLDGFIVTDSDPAGSTNGSDGVIDREFVKDLRSGQYSNGGTFLLCCRSGGGFGIAYQPYIFQPDGSLIKQTGTITNTLTYVPSYLGGNGDNFRDGRQTTFLPNRDRYNASLIGHFEVSPAFVPFVEASYTRGDTSGGASGPFFTPATGSPREAFFSDNPYLSAQARSILLQQDSYDSNCSYAPDGVPDADRAGGGCGVAIYKNVLDLSPRLEKARRETYRAVVGVRGDFNDDWRYELSFNYGRLDEHTETRGNVNVQRYLLAIDPVVQGGNIVCRSKVDPSAAVAYENAFDSAAAASRLAADVAACVPLNLFGAGNISQAARDYVLADSFADGRITQLVLSGFVSGDTSSFFNLPGGPVGFSVGAEYRRETIYYKQDELSAAGLTFYNVIPEFDPTSFEVKEVFGEIRLPILSDLPFFQQLTVTGAGRIADYKGSTGTVYAYNAGVEWSPIRSLRLRTNYARGVRAPNLADQYTPFGQNFAFISDPCSQENIGANPNRAANCAADGVPAGFNYQYTQTLAYQSGGNVNLKAETSDSFTVGGVFQPRFLPGFSLSVDYYNIRVNQAIASLSAQTIVTACYDADTIHNQYCALFSRNQGPGNGPQGEKVGRILEGSLQVVPLNYAKFQAKGIDFEVGYDRQIGNLGRLSLRGIYTMALNSDTYLDPLNPTTLNQSLGELGDPQHAFNVSAQFKSGPITYLHKVRYIGQMVPGTWEDTHSVQGRPPVNEDAYPFKYYSPEVYNDVRLQIDVGRDYNFYLGVDNLFNNLPQYGLTGIGGGSAIYDNRGRFFYAGAVAKF